MTAGHPDCYGRAVTESVPVVSVIVPTRNERENVLALHERVAQALTEISFELLFVDDSSDDTPAILARLADRDPRVVVIHRERGSGLATAVALGFQRARGDVFVVMDGDLQHPPEMIPLMVRLLGEGPASSETRVSGQVVIPSRFLEGADSGEMTPFRRFTTRLALQVARIALPCVRGVNDPNGGFFGVRRGVVEGIQLRPIGWKILVEVLARGRYTQVVEVPYRFAPRLGESSKFSWGEQVRYVRHVSRLLVVSRRRRRPVVIGCQPGALGSI